MTWTPHHRRRTLAAGAMTVFLALTGCSGLGSDADTGGPITVGGTLGITGSLSATSAEYQEVYDWWVEQINARGGLLGRPVEMVIRNDNSTPATAQTLYQSLIEKDDVDLLLAPYSTFVGTPIVPLVRASNKVLFNGGFVNTTLFDSAEGWMVGTYRGQEYQYPEPLFNAISGLAPQVRPRSVAVLTNNNPFTLAVRDGYQGRGGVLKLAADAGLDVVYDETYTGDTTDFTSAVNQARGSGADLFVVVGLPEDSLNIVKTASVLGYRPKIMCACGSQVSTLPAWTSLGPSTNGVVSTTMAWPTQRNNGFGELQAFYEGRGIAQVPTYAAIALAALQVIEQSVTAANTLDQNVLKEYLHSHDFDTAVGKIRFAENGTSPFGMLLTQTTGDTTGIVWPPELATATLNVQGAP